MQWFQLIVRFDQVRHILPVLQNKTIICLYYVIVWNVASVLVDQGHVLRLKVVVGVTRESVVIRGLMTQTQRMDHHRGSVVGRGLMGDIASSVLAGKFAGRVSVERGWRSHNQMGGVLSANFDWFQYQHIVSVTIFKLTWWCVVQIQVVFRIR